MKNFLIGLIIGVLLCGLTLLILIFAMVRFAGFVRQPAGQHRRWVHAGDESGGRRAGAFARGDPDCDSLSIFQSQTPLSVEQVWDTFRRAAADPRIHGILFEPRGLNIGWAKMQEIHDEILEFKKSGKPIITYLHGARRRASIIWRRPRTKSSSLRKTRSI